MNLAECQNCEVQEELAKKFGFPNSVQTLAKMISFFFFFLLFSFFLSFSISLSLYYVVFILVILIGDNLSRERIDNLKSMYENINRSNSPSTMGSEQDDFCDIEIQYYL